MPELPDVEHFRRFFAARAVGARILHVDVTDPAILRNTSARTLDDALRGECFEEPRRHGKWLIVPSTGPMVLVHFGMTGDLVWGQDGRGRHRHDRVIFVLDRGELRYRNMRKLGGLWLAHDRGESEAVLGSLGPDAMDVDRRTFRELLSRRRGGIKAALMDQTFVSGIGNLVADEVLWRARLHPTRRIREISDPDRDRLYMQIRRVLRTWVDRFGDLPARWLIHVRGTEGGTCPRCRGSLERTVVGGRTTYFCPRCQPEHSLH